MRQDVIQPNVCASIQKRAREKAEHSGYCRIIQATADEGNEQTQKMLQRKDPQGHPLDVGISASTLNRRG